MSWLKWIDIPPVWLIAHLVVAYWLPFGLPAFPLLGGAIALIGVALMVLAVFEMRRHRTTPIPHMEADHLVTTGIFAHSRNPIYTGDVLVLAGLSIAWGSLPGVLLILSLVWILYSRFIRPEEARLLAKFADQFEDYCAQVRRWP